MDATQLHNFARNLAIVHARSFGFDVPFTGKGADAPKAESEQMDPKVAEMARVSLEEIHFSEDSEPRTFWFEQEYFAMD